MSAIKIKVIDNTQAFTRRKNEATIEILEAIGEAAVGHAKNDYVPYLDIRGKGYSKGALHDSINFKLTDRAVELHADMPYAAYVELGTYRQEAEPYLQPAIYNHQDEYKDIAESIYRGDEVINQKRRVIFKD